MKAGFCTELINPPIGTTMSGWHGRDIDHGCEGIHDDIYARSLYLSQDDEEMLIVAMDILFLSRDEADRFKGAIGRKLDLKSSQILLNTSHTHAGPKTGKWCYDAPLEDIYIDQLEQTVVHASCKAKQSQKKVNVFIGESSTNVPVSRRLPDGKGGMFWRPYKDGATCDALPVCMLKDNEDKVVCLIHSISCHPSTFPGFEISADFPGVSCNLIDKYFGDNVSMFLQGCGGDTKAGDRNEPRWGNTYNDVEKAGKKIANAVIAELEKGLTESKAELESYAIEMQWPREPDKSVAELKKIAQNSEKEQERFNALNSLERKKKLFKYPDYIPVTMHGIKLAKNMRMISLEGEAVAEWGLMIIDFYKNNGGVTFPLGYSNGTQGYLPIDRMLDEGGYEADSFYEYRQPSRFAKGLDKIVMDSLRKIKDRGIN